MDLKIFTKNIEPEAVNQVYTLAKNKVFDGERIRIMPDVHYGEGVCIGFTSTYSDKVIPSIVGSDIGCGMLTVELGKVDLDLPLIDDVIQEYIPNGRDVHESAIFEFSEMLNLRCKKQIKPLEFYEKALGTLGGGNHFIEIDKDGEGNHYLIIHSGSRNLGTGVAAYYQELAFSSLMGKEKLQQQKVELINEYKSAGKHHLIEAALKEQSGLFYEKMSGLSKSMCYLTGQHLEDYVNDAVICQRFASLNRRLIADTILRQVYGKYTWFDNFETIHNYLDIKARIIRKGAVSAKSGERLLIPINMADGCIIAKGKGVEDWNYSAPHGAGRVYSRSRAKEEILLEEYQERMTGIYTSSVCEATIDEAPMAYKSLDNILVDINGAVDVERLIKPVYNFKSSQTVKSFK